jgi:hypothetical protein
MAMVNNERKAKWLYAMNLVPMAHAEPADALVTPPNTTPNPFETSGASAALAAKRDVDDMHNGTFFFGDPAQQAARNAKRSRPLGNITCHKCGQRTLRPTRLCAHWEPTCGRIGL